MKKVFVMLGAVMLVAVIFVGVVVFVHNNVEEIRLKYGFAGGAGSHFLIDEKGNIIAVAPSIDEIRDFLLKL